MTSEILPGGYQVYEEVTQLVISKLAKLNLYLLKSVGFYTSINNNCLQEKNS